VNRSAERSNTALSALRLVSFVTHERDAVHVGLLTPNAEQVIDLSPLGIADAHEALEQIDLLRRTAGAIVHGAARTAFDVKRVHLVAPVPLARSVVQDAHSGALDFADPATLHGPGDHLGRAESAHVCAGLAAVLGATIEATETCSDDALTDALIGTLLVLGWPQPGPDGDSILRPGAVGPFVAVPRRAPATLELRRVTPVIDPVQSERITSCAAPTQANFFALARAALRSHTLRPGDLLTIFPVNDMATEHSPMLPGSWVRVSAPGQGTLSLAVR
jgi:hypothetical protein